MPRLKLAYSGVALNGAELSDWPAFPCSGVFLESQSAMLIHHGLAGLFHIRKALAEDLPHPINETLKVVHIAVIVSESLFVQVCFQVEWFDADISASQCPLRATPEVLHAVRMDRALCVRDGVVDNCMVKFIADESVGLQRICVQLRS